MARSTFRRGEGWILISPSWLRPWVGWRVPLLSFPGIICVVLKTYAKGCRASVYLLRKGLMGVSPRIYFPKGTKSYSFISQSVISSGSVFNGTSYSLGISCTVLEWLLILVSHALLRLSVFVLFNVATVNLQEDSVRQVVLSPCKMQAINLHTHADYHCHPWRFSPSLDWYADCLVAGFSFHDHSLSSTIHNPARGWHTRRKRAREGEVCRVQFVVAYGLYVAPFRTEVFFLGGGNQLLYDIIESNFIADANRAHRCCATTTMVLLKKNKENRKIKGFCERWSRLP